MKRNRLGKGGYWDWDWRGGIMKLGVGQHSGKKSQVGNKTENKFE